MNALELRKQLLIAESELNRIQLRAERAALHSGLHTITHGASTVGALASSAAILATHLATIPRKQPAAGTNASGLKTVLYGAVLISSVWLAVIPRKS
jgi:hypothetical protein